MKTITTFAALTLTALGLAACAPAPGDAPQATNPNNDFDATAETSVQQDVRGVPAVQ